MNKGFTIWTMVLLIIMAIISPIYSQELFRENSIIEDNKIINFQDKNLESLIRDEIHKTTGNIVLRDVKNIKALDGANKEIYDLRGLENLIDLEELNLSKNYLENIQPIGSLKKLRYLNLWENKIKDISILENNTNLEILDLDSNKIEDIDKIKNLTKLKHLRLGSNRIKDISVLEELYGLEYLCLWSNMINDISPLGGLKNLKELRLAYNNIQDISSLQYLEGLESLNLFNNNISCIEALKSLKSLRELFLMDNKIFAIEALNDITNLESLKIDNNRINDLTPLENLKKLRFLSLSNNGIESIVGVENLTNIEYLELNNNRIKDVKSLEQLKKLSKLFLNNNHIKDISSIMNNRKLILLSASNNDISDIKALEALRDLLYLDISHNRIEDMKPLKNLNNIRWLYLDGNNIKEIDALGGNKSIEKLSVSNNEIIDISPLENMMKLEELYLDNNKIQDISGIEKNSSLIKIELQNNNIRDIKSLLSLRNINRVNTYGNPLSKAQSTFNYLNIDKGITVHGKITDAYRGEQRGSDTRVSLIKIDEPDYRLFSTKSDKYGDFIIDGVQPGKYKITFVKKGYKPLTIYSELVRENQRINVKIEEMNNPKWNKRNTKRVIFNYREGMQVSQKEIEIVEGRLKDIEELLGVTLDQPINYYMCIYPEEIYELAYGKGGKFAIGTYVSRTNSLYTINDTMDFHEITHGVEYKYNPNYNTSLGEGLAVFFGEGKLGAPIALNRPINDLARELAIKNQFKDINNALIKFEGDNDYIISGSLVTFLLEEYTLEQFRELFKKLPRNPNRKDIEKIIKEIYDRSVKQLDIQWLEYLGMQ